MQGCVLGEVAGVIKANPLKEPVGVAKWVGRPPPVLGDFLNWKTRFESVPHIFKPWSSQTNDFKIYAYHFLAQHSALLE